MIHFYLSFIKGNRIKPTNERNNSYDLCVYE